MFTFARLSIDHMNQGFIVGKKKIYALITHGFAPKVQT